MASSFSFGNNWRRFLDTLNEDRIEEAEQSLTDFLGRESLTGMSFVDVGCGSGLFSLAAHRLGAARIVSFDIDPMSVECCRELHAKAGNPKSWRITNGSVLDEAFLARLGTFDIVYSWGVLHHTGRMWDAIDNVTELTGPGGYLYIALYNKLLNRSGDESWIHDFWIRVKKLYQARPNLGTYVMEPLALTGWLGVTALQGKNPIAAVRNYQSHRGMDWRTDARDWLGGLPYEYATVEEVFTFVRSRHPDFNLEALKITGGRGLNWYLFSRRP